MKFQVFGVQVEVLTFRERVRRVVESEGKIPAIRYVREHKKGKRLGSLMEARIYVGEICGDDLTVVYESRKRHRQWLKEHRREYKA